VVEPEFSAKDGASELWIPHVNDCEFTSVKALSRWSLCPVWSAEPGSSGKGLALRKSAGG
jgi:hypothetical protein